MDELTETSQSQFKSKLRPADLALFTKFRKAREKDENAPDTLSDDEKTALSDAKEAAQFLYLTSLTKNDALPADFKAEVQKTLDDYKKSAPEEVFERAMMRYAKTPEEKQEFQKALDEVKNQK